MSDEEKPKEAPDELTITLRKPVKLGDETITELNLREPTMGEVEKFVKSTDRHDNLTAMNLFIASISGVNKAAIDMIGARDGKAAREYLSAFL